MKIIALFSQKKRIGKTTISKALYEELNEDGMATVGLSYADALKRECAEALSASPSDRNWLRVIDQSDAKDTPVEMLKVDMVHNLSYRNFLYTQGHNVNTPRSWRWHLAQYGTEYRRRHLKDDNVWINKLSERVLNAYSDGAEFIIIDDLRTLGEAMALSLFKDVTLVELQSHDLGSTDLTSYAKNIRESLETTTVWNVKGHLHCSVNPIRELMGVDRPEVQLKEPPLHAVGDEPKYLIDPDTGHTLMFPPPPPLT